MPRASPGSPGNFQTSGASTTTDITLVGGAAISLGQKTMANSFPVVIASDQSAITVSVSGTVAVTNADLTTIAGDTTSIDGKIPALGQALAAASVPVVLTAAQLTTLTPLATVAVTQSGTWDEVGINDSGNSITVDAPVGTPIFVRLSDGAAAITTLPVSLASVPSHDVTNAGTFAVQAAQSGAWTVTANAGTNLNTSALALESGGNLAGAATSLAILDDWDETNRAAVNTIAGQIGVQGGSGTTNALTQRVVLATDVALPTGSNAIGKLAANSGVDIGDVDVTSIAAGTNKIGDVDIAPRTTGGWSVGNFTSGDTYTALTNSAQVIKASAGKFGGYYIYNPNTSATYVMVYNIAAGSVTVGTSTAKLVFCIPASSGANLELLAGIPFDTALSIAAATTGGGNTAPATALEAMVLYV